MRTATAWAGPTTAEATARAGRWTLRLVVEPRSTCQVLRSGRGREASVPLLDEHLRAYSALDADARTFGICGRRAGEPVGPSDGSHAAGLLKQLGRPDLEEDHDLLVAHLSRLGPDVRVAERLLWADLQAALSDARPGCGSWLVPRSAPGHQPLARR